MVIKIRDERQMKALTGLSFAEFDRLLPVFTAVYEARQQRRYEQAVQAGSRRRKPCPGGSRGRKSKLPTMDDKLFFVLYYFKAYPTFDQPGLSPTARCAAATSALQWEKKRHTLKNTIITTTAKVILFVGGNPLGAFSGHHHDYTMLKTEFPPDYDWFAALTVLVDLGYLGIRTDYPGADILLPHKKPRQSQRHPQPALTSAQKADNRAISQVRVAIEQALAGLKRYNILVHRFRNRRANFHDEVIALCAGLWNFALIY